MRRALLLLIGGLGLLLWTCQPEEPPTPATVSYRRDIQPIFNTFCTSCHMAPDGQGYREVGLDLTAYDSLMTHINTCTQEPLVIPGNSEASYLMEKLGGNPRCGQPMPLGQTLPQEYIEKIATWIDEGARDN